MLGQGEIGMQPMSGSEQCKRDYEKDIESLDDKIRATLNLQKAAQNYCFTVGVDLYRPDTFTFPQLLGHMILQEKQLADSRDWLIAEWERVKAVEG